MTQSPLTITLATHNEGKRRELMHWVQQSDLPLTLVCNDTTGEVEETGHTFLENARLKASQTPPVIPNGFVLAEDSGMIVDALDGQYGISPFPGIYSNRWLTPAIRNTLLPQSFPNRMPLDRITETGVTNSDLCHAILALMKNQPHRAARYCCGMVLWHPERGCVFDVLESSPLWIIDSEPRGLNGFGYDPITLPLDPHGQPGSRTMAELSLDEKNQISHRGFAFKKLLSFLGAHLFL